MVSPLSPLTYVMQQKGDFSGEVNFPMCCIIYVTGSRGIGQMSGILILSYRLKEVRNSYVLHCFEFQKLFIVPQLDIRLTWGLDQNVAF